MHLWKTQKHELVYFYRLIPTWTSNCRAREFEPVWRNIGQRCHQRDKHKDHSEVGWLVMRLLWSTAFKFNIIFLHFARTAVFSVFDSACSDYWSSANELFNKLTSVPDHTSLKSHRQHREMHLLSLRVGPTLHLCLCWLSYFWHNSSVVISSVRFIVTCKKRVAGYEDYI